jgi:hypothetical protein
VRVLRTVLLLLGVAGLAVGGVLLLDSVQTLPDVAVWAGAGVVLHDGLWAPLVFFLGLLGVTRVRGPLRAPLMTGLWVSAAVTLVALPVLGRFGERPDNPSLLNRNYTAGWLVVLAVVWALVVAWMLVAHRAAPRADAAPGADAVPPDPDPGQRS